MEKTIYSLALITHIIGITLMAGTSFIDYLTLKKFGKLYPTDQSKAQLLYETTGLLQRIMSYGLLFIIISGIGMMAFVHKIYGQQTWMQVKICLVIIVIVTGQAFRRRMGKKLNSTLNASPETRGAAALAQNIKTVQVIQLLLIVTIFILSVFKFN